MTEELLRVFGRRSALGGLTSSLTGGFGGGGGGYAGSTGSGGGGGAAGGGSYDPGFNILVDPLSEGGYFQDFVRIGA